jgi:glycosyltransferase involved in cell wall biosynthesis
MYEGLTVGVVVPAYNEEGYVGDVIDAIPACIDRAYVVEDGSTDGTWAEITSHAEARNNDHDGAFDRLVVPIRHDENRGVGGAIKTGYQRAREEGIDVTAVLGGDDQMDPSVLTEYFDPIARGEAEYVKGNRFADPSHWAAMPRFRLFGNVVLSYLTKIASGYWGLMDSQNGYTAIAHSALETTDIDGMYEYYGYCNDLLIRLNEADVTVADLPRSSEYAYSDDWKSHIDYKEYIPRVSAMLARGFVRRLVRKYLLTDYNPIAPLYGVGTVGLLGGVAGLVRSLLGGGDSDTGSWTLTTIVSALVFLGATELDRRENERLQADLLDEAPEDAGPPDRTETERAAADAGIAGEDGNTPLQNEP